MFACVSSAVDVLAKLTEPQALVGGSGAGVVNVP